VAAAVAQLTPGGVQLPHLLFYGPPGTGKTSAILALAKDLFGPQMYRSRVLELNASDERGIEVVRNKIKHFASLAVSANKSTTHPCPPFKLIILDEADSMTVDAQSALRRTMETYTKVTRFCILCNYVSRIIGPIASRCAKFRFQPMCKEVMTSRLSFIADKEGFSLPQDAAQALLKVSGGDLRRAITLLQNTYMLHGQDMKGKHITDAAAVIPDEVMLDLLAACKSNSFDKMQVCVCAHVYQYVYVCVCVFMCVCVCS
jgi:replication factor C subunit 2/4